MFNDSAAKIRNYLRYSYYDLGVRYALLIGDTNNIGEGYFPIRYVYSGDLVLLQMVCLFQPIMK